MSKLTEQEINTYYKVRFIFLEEEAESRLLSYMEEIAEDLEGHERDVLAYADFEQMAEKFEEEEDEDETVSFTWEMICRDVVMDWAYDNDFDICL